MEKIERRRKAINYKYMIYDALLKRLNTTLTPRTRKTPYYMLILDELRNPLTKILTINHDI